MDATSTATIPSSSVSPPSTTPLHMGPWNAIEDERLRRAVAECGTRWVAVAAKVGTRNGEQCAKRWNHKLNPDLNHSFWSPEEDKLLMHLVTVCGHNWKLMADNFLLARAPLSLKNRYSLLMRRQKRENAKQQHHAQHSQFQPKQQLGLQQPPESRAAPSAESKRVSDNISLLQTPPPTDYHPPCNIELVDINPARLEAPTSGFLLGQKAPPPLNTAVSTASPGSNKVARSAGSEALNAASITLDFSELLANNDVQNQHHINPYRRESDPEIDLDDFLDNVSFSISSSGTPQDDVSVPPQQSAAAITLGGSDEVKSNGKGIEFSVTCSRSRLKAMVCHAFEGAIIEAAGLSEEEPVTVTLRLKR